MATHWNTPKDRVVTGGPSQGVKLAPFCGSQFARAWSAGRLGCPCRAPSRSLPAGTNLTFLLQDKLEEQKNLCALCGKLMRLDSTKKLLQCSPDRIISTNPSYGADNLQIAHLACNLAKNDGSTEDFEEWLELISEDVVDP